MHEVEVEVPGFGSVSVVSVHLAGSVEERLAQADDVTRIFGSTAHPVILAGDFNGRPERPVLRRLRLGWSVLEKTGTRFTFPSNQPDREIDFVMARPAGSVRAVEHRVIADSITSDHRPLLAVVELPPGQ